jgi:hypothetical protein
MQQKIRQSVPGDQLQFQTFCTENENKLAASNLFLSTPFTPQSKSVWYRLIPSNPRAC